MHDFEDLCNTRDFTYAFYVDTNIIIRMFMLNFVHSFALYVQTLGATHAATLKPALGPLFDRHYFPHGESFQKLPRPVFT